LNLRNKLISKVYGIKSRDVSSSHIDEKRVSTEYYTSQGGDTTLAAGGLDNYLQKSYQRNV
jgi:hypothetical protein